MATLISICVCSVISGWTVTFYYVTTIHKDITERLRRADPTLWQQVRAVLDQNKAERHIRGGIATRMKYKEAEKAR